MRILILITILMITSVIYSGVYNENPRKGLYNSNPRRGFYDKGFVAPIKYFEEEKTNTTATPVKTMQMQDWVNYQDDLSKMNADAFSNTVIQVKHNLADNPKSEIDMQKLILIYHEAAIRNQQLKKNAEDTAQKMKYVMSMEDEDQKKLVSELKMRATFIFFLDYSTENVAAESKYNENSARWMLTNGYKVIIVVKTFNQTFELPKDLYDQCNHIVDNDYRISRGFGADYPSVAAGLDDGSAVPVMHGRAPGDVILTKTVISYRAYLKGEQTFNKVKFENKE